MRPKQLSGISTHSSPPTMNDILPYIPARRPTEVLYRPPPAPRQLIRLPQNEDNEIVAHFNMHEEEENILRKPTMNPSQKQREQSIENDNRQNKVIEKVEPAQINQRRLSLPKHLPPVRLTNGDNKRRPIKFDKSLLLDEPTYSSTQKNGSTLELQQQQQNKQPSNVDQSRNQHNDKEIVMEVIHQELNERPLNDTE
ncbi:unnamed protein product [Rotaria sp. Silwood1]|nr:unnamed protein product [Rotaria sp. Silwood1]CAF3556354.1 unnamed protein product [Rotaria sp. Silwood1]CAF4679401.1 unnamed protein product [Rotaria sp. Silwood1]